MIDQKSDSVIAGSAKLCIFLNFVLQLWIVHANRQTAIKLSLLTAVCIKAIFNNTLLPVSLP
jgi:hypothetical protein